MRTPVLETARLFLRRPTRSDLGTVFARLKAGDRHVASAALAGEGALAQAVMIACHWDLSGTGLFAVLPKGSDAPIGLTGPWKATGWAQPELGFLFHDTPDADTLAPEALRCARGYSEAVIGWREITTLVRSEDRRAAALLRASGAIADPFGDAPEGALSFCHPVRSSDRRRAA
ncbi:GNAT family N-acetyltransferase [Tropicimonas sp. IMCC6043]|uniref:GNAT family N-acetyltransferase n=1 Tax=Tropicimonas sp. IMCC6043 TaxID=2510645 RepID=UPI00101B613B|nr:GNAT family N-acetyltransferase [Tropicimonas sp. IMCC6043]RYH09027.1 N-acetyltransferase [Tropicimonas sp. IMCC6043]